MINYIKNRGIEIISVVLIGSGFLYFSIVLHKQDYAIKITERYYQSLSHYDKANQNLYVSKNLISNLKKQASTNSAFANYLKLFKQNSERFPVNVYEFLQRHMAINPSFPKRVDLSREKVCFELYLCGSQKIPVKITFLKQDDTLFLDDISNLGSFFELIDCQKNYLVVVNH